MRPYAFFCLFCACTAIQAQDSQPPATTPNLLYTFVGGIEQVGLSSKPSQTEPFVRLYIQSGAGDFLKHEVRLWASVRLLGAPTQSDTQGIFSVFADPSGQITTEKLSSVGSAVDFAVGAAYRLSHWSTPNSADLILGFGATTPFNSDQVTQAFTTPVFGTNECNILYNKFKLDFGNPAFAIQQSKTGTATGSTTACLLNTNSSTTSNGTTTYAPVNTVAFSYQDRTSFLLKDMVGLRLNHTAKVDSKQDDCTVTSCYLGSVDLTFGHDSSTTGGVLRGNRWLFKVDGVFPIIVANRTTVYLFGSFSTRIERNQTDNTPLILQAATLPTTAGANGTPVPNINTLVLPLRQPDRDFYRIGVGIDVVGLFKK